MLEGPFSKKLQAPSVPLLSHKANLQPILRSFLSSAPFLLFGFLLCEKQAKSPFSEIVDSVVRQNFPWLSILVEIAEL